jgi:hypothetical protein
MSKARDIASAAPAPSTVSATELGYVDGVTSAIQTQLDAKTAKSTLTTTGDIYYASAANTPARLGIGSTGNVLTVASGIPSWSAPAAGGGMTLLNSGNTSLAGVQTLTISDIPNTYKHLYVVGMGIYTTNNYGANLQMRFNGDSAGNYRSTRMQVVDNTIGGEASVNAVTSSLFLSEINQSSNYEEVTFFQVTIPLYANTTQYKRTEAFSSCKQGGSVFENKIAHKYNSTSAISSLTFFTSNSSTGNFQGDSAVYVYGVN